MIKMNEYLKFFYDNAAPIAYFSTAIALGSYLLYRTSKTRKHVETMLTRMFRRSLADGLIDVSGLEKIVVDKKLRDKILEGIPTPSEKSQSGGDSGGIRAPGFLV